MKTPYLPAILFLLTTTNCGRMITSGASAASLEKPSSTDAADAEKACEAIFSKKEASQFADGKTMTLLASGYASGDISLACMHSFTGNGEIVVIKVSVVNASGLRRQIPPEGRAESGAMSDAQLISEWQNTGVKRYGGTPVPGIGDEAWESGGLLSFRMKNTLVGVVITGLPQSDERAIKIAKLIQDRIPK